MRPRGIALLMGLVLLAAISLIALMATNGMVLQRRMSANFAERTRALGDAAQAEAAARAWLDSRSDMDREAGCLADCMLPAAIHSLGELPRNPEFKTAAWWQSNGVPAGTNPETGEPLDADVIGDGSPVWMIEEISYEALPAPVAEPSIAGVGYYRIYARGGSGGSVAVTEAIIAHPWDGAFEPLPYPSSEPAGFFCRQFASEMPCGMQAWRRRR